MSEQTSTPVTALAGIKVLDLTRLLPGAFGTMMLADMGAEVIKIEEPGKGDYNRAFPPIAKAESGSFLLLNRNKKSVAINLKDEQGKRLFLAMARQVDVVIEGFRPGVMDRLGLGYEVLKAENPLIVYCAISGYGQDGPYRLLPGHDLNYLAIAGALGLFGKAGEGPIVPGLSIADIGGGSLMAVSGILAALIGRGTTGEGQFVDISMTDGTLSWLALHAADRLFADIEPRGGERPLIGQAPCYNVYECADDGHVALGCIEVTFWHRFCDAVSMPELKDEHWPDGERAAAQHARLRDLFLGRTREEWTAFLAQADIPFTGVNTMREALYEDPQMRHREMLQHVDHPVEGRIPQLGFPIKLSGTPCAICSAPPRLGEHTRGVLGALGCDDEEIAELEGRAVIRTAG